MPQPAARQNDPVVGTDTHILLVPSPGGPVPTPTPLPFNGKLLSAHNFAPITWARGVDLKTGRPIENRGIRYDKTGKHLNDLVNQVNTAAQKLHASATTTDQTDAEAARRLNQVLDELSH